MWYRRRRRIRKVLALGLAVGAVAAPAAQAKIPEPAGKAATPPVVKPAPEVGGFDWGDAAIGAAVASGLVIMAGSAALVRRHGRLAGA
jgi:hypothetical protein